MLRKEVKLVLNKQKNIGREVNTSLNFIVYENINR
jgi:hypothetical protein